MLPSMQEWEQYAGTNQAPGLKAFVGILVMMQISRNASYQESFRMGQKDGMEWLRNPLRFYDSFG